MITSLRLVSFKNFADEILRVGPFTLIVGTNASGKSNIRDAFRFLHGIGRGYTLAEILGGKYGGGGQKEWDPIRGAPFEVAQMGPLHPKEPAQFSIYCEFELAGKEGSYSITVGINPQSPDPYRVWNEELKSGGKTIFASLESDDPGHYLVFGRDQSQRGYSPAQPALSQIQQGDLATWYQKIDEVGLHEVLEKIRFFDWSPMRMREPSDPGFATLGHSGENLPSALKAICANSALKSVLTSWLQELTPMDVRDLEFPADPSGRIHLYIVEADGNKISAYSASDGTLRFLATLAALFEENSQGLYFFEELDNGIHPTRLWLLLELIEKQTGKGEIQVITTTHSPDLLNYVNDETFEHTSVVYRNSNSTEAIICPVSNLSNARELRASQSLGRLQSTGWIEDVLTFSELEDGKLGA